MFHTWRRTTKPRLSHLALPARHHALTRRANVPHHEELGSNGMDWSLLIRSFPLVTFSEEILILVLTRISIPEKHYTYFSFHFVKRKKKDYYLSAPSILVVHVLLAIERKARCEATAKKNAGSSSLHYDTAEAISLPATSSTSLALCASLSQMFFTILFWNLLLLIHSMPTSISHRQLPSSDAALCTLYLKCT
jgi:hypothetical protein